MGDFFQKTPREKVKISDPRGPRCRTPRHVTINREVYDKYLEQNPNSKLTFTEFKQICLRGNTLYRQAIMKNREGIELPERMGRMFIGAYEKGKDKPYYDWAVLRKKKVAYSHKNWESDRYVCKLFYTNFGNQNKYQLRQYWYFNGCRKATEETSKNFRENWNFYVKIPRFQKMSELDKLEFRTIKITHHEPNSGRVDFTDTQPH